VSALLCRTDSGIPHKLYAPDNLPSKILSEDRTVVSDEKLIPGRAHTLQAALDRAIVALLLYMACDRSKWSTQDRKIVQVHEKQCLVADLVGKGKYIQTVPCSHLSETGRVDHNRFYQR
jgi:hypothetical protein